MKVLLDGYKFEGVRASYRIIARLLHESLPELPVNSVVVPVPTTPHNVRVRGYDHMLLIAREFGALRSLAISPLLYRKNNVTQHFAKTASERHRQAKDFFATRGNIDKNITYMVMDDIFTTGATLEAASLCLREAGASTVWAVVVARQ